MAEHFFLWQDYVVFVAILIISVAIGIFQACTKGKQRTNQEYFLGDRKLQFVPVGLSIVVTFQSCLAFMGAPAETYTKGISYLLVYSGVILAQGFLCFVIVPLFYPLKLISTYEYLERRFHSKFARILGSIISMISMLLLGGVNVYAPAIAISTVSGIPVWISMLVIGLLATIYTSLGGLRAVVWTDVFQCTIMLIGILAVVIQGSIMQGGIARVWHQSAESGRTDFGSWSPDPRERHTIWGLVIGGTLLWTSVLGVSQSSVQRISSVSSMREAKIAFLVGIPGFMIFGITTSLIGLIIYSYFLDKGCDPLESGIIRNPNQLIVIFLAEVFNFMPGFSGMFVASICCAALSTVSSCINGLSAMAWEDIFKGRCTQMSPKASNIFVKVLGFVYGLLLVAVAFLAMSTPGSIVQIGISFIGASGGPLLGMFLLGAFFPRSNWIGVTSGALVGVILCMWLALGSKTISPWPSMPPAPTTNCTSAANASSLIVSNNGSTLDFTYVTEDTATLSPPTTVSSSILEPFYRISYVWYSLIGTLIVLVVGLVVSYLTGPMNPKDIERNLYFLPLEKIASKLPKSCRRRFPNCAQVEADSHGKDQPENASPDDKHLSEKGNEMGELRRGLLETDETKV